MISFHLLSRSVVHSYVVVVLVLQSARLYVLHFSIFECVYLICTADLSKALTGKLCAFLVAVGLFGPSCLPSIPSLIRSAKEN